MSAEIRRDRNKETFERLAEAGAGAVAQIEIDNWRDAYLGAEATVIEAEAEAEQAQLAYDSRINGIHTQVARVQAELHDAEYDLAQTEVLAPTDG